MSAGQLWLGIATIIAVFAGPVFAVQVEKYLERNRAAENRKLDVFRRLMVTRAAPLNVNHIDALNLIEAEYDPRKASDKMVLDRWHEYWDHLNTRHGGTPAEETIWRDARASKMGDVLYEMSQYLDLGIDRSVLKRASYYPQYLETLEAENAAIRKALVEMYSRPLRVQIVEGDLAPRNPQQPGARPAS
ncbi:MAG TPA: DUF6680 family protein [Terriglobia bacterium]|nr:DUF6680 family protein [Terriglobia bacterium]